MSFTPLNISNDYFRDVDPLADMQLTYDVNELTMEESLEQLYGGILVKDLRRVITNRKSINFGIQAQLFSKQTFQRQLSPKDRPDDKVVNIAKREYDMMKEYKFTSLKFSTLHFYRLTSTFKI